MSDTSQRKLHIAFASAEAAPFVKTGGLGDVAGSLPQALKAAGAEVVVLVPKYDTIAQEYKDRMEHLCDFYVPLGWRNEYCGIERLNHKGVDYLFIDNERYFSRGYPYGFFDDGERFAFFSKAIVESLQYLPYALDNFTCDVLHCNDWHTALAPVFLREFYQDMDLYRNVKTVFSIHNIAFQGQFTAKVLNDILGLAHIPAAAFQLTCGPDAVNYMQGALNYTDSITTVSPTYAEEIKTPDFGEHLDGLLRRRAPILQGILNGIDVEGFDPATDPRIAANFTVADRSGKAVCKAKLQEELGLEVRDDRPLMVMVTRLTRQKGMDLVTYALDRILSGGVQVAVLGTGDTEYENALRYFEGKYPGTMAARIQFDPALSQRMYAAADLFLMPSLFEPCGLSQIIAMRYGTLPVVRETGGLKDTVIPYNQFTGEGTGFSFAHFNGDELGDAVFRAARLFWDDRAAFDQLVTNAMEQDFSWTRSAGAYMALYHNLHPEIPLPEVKEVKAEVHEAAPAASDEKTADEEVEAAEKTDSERQAATSVSESAAAVTEQLPLDDVTPSAPAPAAKKAPAKKPATKKTATKAATAKAGTTKAAAAKPAATKAAAPKAATAKTAAKKPEDQPTASKTTTARKSATAKTTAKAAATKTTTAKVPVANPAAAGATTATTAKPSATTTKATAATKAATTKATKAAAPKTTATPAASKTTAAKAATTTAAAKKTAAAKATATKAPAAKATVASAATSATQPTAPAKTAAAKAPAKPVAETTAPKTIPAKSTTAKAAAKTATATKMTTPAATKTAAKPAPAAKEEAPVKKAVSKLVPKVSRTKRK